MNIEELKTEILRLNPEARANLAREILASLDAMSESEIEALWIEEAVATRGFCAPSMYVHSANASARLKMEYGIESIKRFTRLKHP